jgi:RHS repeat-associated protein
VDGDGFLVALDLGEVVLGFGGARRYRHFDFRGNVSFVSDESGSIVTLYGYSPYGVNVVVGDGSDDTRFVGRGGIGPLMLLGARMYDPLVGRFLSPDPVFSLLNQYAYTLGNPIWFSDSDGREMTAGQALAIVGFALAVVGVVVGVISVLTSVAPAVGLGIAVVSFFVAGFSLVFAFSESSPSVPAVDNTGCGCTPTLELNLESDTSAVENPSGAAPPGSDHGGGGSSGASVSAGGGGVGGGIGGGFGGGLGGSPACGLTGLEFLFFVGFILARREKRRAR